MDRRRGRVGSRERPKIPSLDWKMPPNPKYADVKPTVDSGNSLRKRMER